MNRSESRYGGLRGRFSTILIAFAVAAVSCAAVVPSLDAATFGQVGFWGAKGTGAGELNFPLLLGSDPTGTEEGIYVADTTSDFGNLRIQKFSNNGTTVLGTSASLPLNSFATGYLGIAVDPTRHRFYLLTFGTGADTSNGKNAAQSILVFSTIPNGSHELVGPGGGAPTTLAVPSPTGETALDNPHEFSVDPQNGDLVIEAENREAKYVLQRIHADGSGEGARYTETGTTTPLNKAVVGTKVHSGIAIGPDGSSYIMTGEPSSNGTKDTLWKLPQDFSGTPAAVTGFAAAASGEGWGKSPRFEYPLALSASFGPQLAISPSGETIYWKEQFSSALNTTTTPGSFIVRGYSLTDGHTALVYGGKETEGECTVQTKTAALVPSGEELLVLDQGSNFIEGKEEQLYGANVLRFGPGGSNCPAPAASIHLKLGASEVSTVPAGSNVTLDGSSFELGSWGPTLESFIWKIEGPEGTIEETVAAPTATLDHVFAQTGTYTVRLGMKMATGTFAGMGKTYAAKRKQLVVTGAAPTVTSLAPTHGPAAGGTTVTITGTNLSGAEEVKFGAAAVACPKAGAPDKCVVKSATEIEVESPAGTAGSSVDVTVKTAAGTSATSANDKYAYDAVVPAPTVTSLAPTHGPAAGGTTVTITGTNLSGATEVKFGGVAATGLTPVSATELKATSPAGTAGTTVDVTVTTGGGISATGASDKYTYDVPPAPQQLTVTMTGSGTVTSAPTGIDCGGTCSASFVNGSVVTLTATPASGSSFGGWGGACSGTGSCVVAMISAKSVTATFNAASSGSGSSGSSSAGGSSSAPNTAPVTPTPAPAPKRLTCKKGFKKVKVKGKAKCVKVKKKTHRAHRPVASRPLLGIDLAF